ncbi:hypothetical protein K438DRAFT_1976579 [Mycena galopus ATCC 62051]|nr:hypothetical protein K438DRAFT_1976579 [Mycena galopus ATCC 62051]
MSSIAGMCGGFAVPGTPARNALLRKKQQASQPDIVDPQTGFVKPATPPRSGLGSRRRRDHPPKEISAERRVGLARSKFPRSGRAGCAKPFAERGEATAAFDRLHLKPITIATERNHAIARRLWIEWFTQYCSSSQRAEETLTKDAAFLPLAQVKQFFFFLSTNGTSALGISGATGWSLHTTRVFVGRIFAVFRRTQTTPPKKTEPEEILAVAVLESAHKDKLSPTQKKPKRMLVETDLVEFMATTMKHTVQITSNFMCIQMNALTGFLYTHGFRPGCVVDARGYKGCGEHLKWKHSEWLIYGWDKGAGLGLQSFWVMHWCKGQRFDESLNVSTSMRNLGRSKPHIDSQLMLETLAITSDVFEENLLELRTKDPKTLTFPIRLHIKPHALELPVFRNANKTDSLTYLAAAHLLTKIKKVLRWGRDYSASITATILMFLDFSFLSLRYSFASAMVNKLSEVHLCYLMGHTRGSKLSTTTYQVPNRVADVSGTLFDEENTSFVAMALMHSSVSWNRPTAPPDDKVKNDIGMKKLGNTDQLVVDVLEITAETLEHYMSLSAGQNLGQLRSSTYPVVPAVLPVPPVPWVPL